MFAMTNERFGLNPTSMKNLFKLALRLIDAEYKETEGGIVITRSGRWEKTLAEIKRRKNNPILIFDHSQLLVQEHNRRVFRQSETKELLTLGHPLMERALATFRSHLWDHGTELTRWTVAIDPEVNRDVMRVNVLLIYRNKLSEIMHSTVETLEFGMDLQEYTVEYLGTTDIPIIPEDAKRVERIDQIQRRIRPLWAANVDLVKDEVKAFAESISSRLQVEVDKQKQTELEREKQILSERLEELKDRSMNSNRLRKELEKEKKTYETMQVDSIDRYFDPEEHKRQLALQRMRIEKLTAEIDEFFQKGYSEYVKTIENAARQESEFVQKNIIPNRYTIRSQEYYVATVGFHLTESTVQEVTK